jgi:hypothetical protein
VKLFILLACVCLVAASRAGELFISEYCEGSSFNKAIEIYNGTAATIHLADHRLGLASNGAATPTLHTFSGSLAPGAVFVVAHPNAAPTLLALAHATSSTFANWNGNDFVGLYRMQGGSPLLLDGIGVLGQDPGAGWPVAGVAAATKDRTLARKPAVAQGTVDWSLSAGTSPADSQWDVLPQDTFTGFGSHAVDSDSPPLVANVAHLPALPTDSQAVTVSAEVSDDGLLALVELSWSAGAAWTTTPMSSAAAPLWQGLIPAQPAGALVEYFVRAVDDQDLESVSAGGGYLVGTDPIPTDAAAPVFLESGLALGQVSTTGLGTATAHLVNEGEQAVHVKRIEVVGGPFTVSPASAWIPPGQVLELLVQIQPPHNLHYEAWLTASGDWGATALPLSADGDYPGTTWDGTYNLSGSALKTVLAGLVAGQTPLSYDAARLAMFSNLDNVDGWVECVYTGALVQTAGIPDPAVMNTEHTWPQSYGAEGEARSDLHHLYPTNAWVNNSRGNLPFGVVLNSSPGYPLGGSNRGTNAAGVTVFEPRDLHKGDCARAVMYFALRYGNREGFLDMAAQEAVLRAWHLSDPVSPKETTRNAGIAALQANRNPFIEQPGLLLRLASLAGSADLPAGPAARVMRPDTLRRACPGEPVTVQLWLGNPGGSPLIIHSLVSDEPDCLVPGTVPASLAPGAGLLFPLTIQGPCDGQANLLLDSSAGQSVLPLFWTWLTPGLEAPDLSIQREAGGSRLTWNAIPGATAYRVEIALEVMGPWMPLVVQEGQEFWLVDGLWPEAAFFRVAALDL